MRASRIIVSTAVTAAAIGLSATAAIAEGPGPADVVPKSATPGSSVTVNTNYCKGDSLASGQTATGVNFDLHRSGGKSSLSGRFEVPSDTKPGTYAIAVLCPNGTMAQSEVIVSGATTQANQEQARPAQKPAPANTSASAKAAPPSPLPAKSDPRTLPAEPATPLSSAAPAPAKPATPLSAAAPAPAGSAAAEAMPLAERPAPAAEAGAQAEPQAAPGEMGAGEESPAQASGAVRAGIGSGITGSQTTVGVCLLVFALGGAYLLHRQSRNENNENTE